MENVLLNLLKIQMFFKYLSVGLLLLITYANSYAITADTAVKGFTAKTAAAVIYDASCGTAVLRCDINTNCQIGLKPLNQDMSNPDLFSIYLPKDGNNSNILLDFTGKGDFHISMSSNLLPADLIIVSNRHFNSAHSSKELLSKLSSSEFSIATKLFSGSHLKCAITKLNAAAYK